MASPVLQFKRGAFADLPALSAGEPGFTTDRYDLYIGTGAGNTASNIFVGSHRFWGIGSTDTGSSVKVVEGTDNGDNSISLKSPDTLSASYTLTLPSDDGAADSVLTSDGSGNLSWVAGSNNSTFTGITTFSDTTDNTLGDANTGAVQIDGGLGINKNVTIGAGLSVTGNSYFVGMVTFAAGASGNISIGDTVGDNIIVNGRIDSDLIPDDDGTYDLGSSSLEWQDLYIDGTAYIDALNADTADIDGGTIDGTTIGGSTAAAGTFTNLVANGNVDLGDDAANDTITATGRFDSNLVPSTTGTRDLGTSSLEWNNLYIDGTANIDSLVADTADINGGSIDNTTIGASTPSTGVFTTVTATNVQVTNVKANDGTSSITITDSSGDVSIASTLTVDGDLVVKGAQTIVNTETLKVEDSLVEVGLVNSGGDLVAPSSDANIDVGLIFHYYSGSAKKAAVYWDDSVSRIVVASDVSESNSVLTATANTGYSDLEIKGLYINDCAGQSQVITCTGSERFLENITIDGGSFS